MSAFQRPYSPAIRHYWQDRSTAGPFRRSRMRERVLRRPFEGRPRLLNRAAALKISRAGPWTRPCNHETAPREMTKNKAWIPIAGVIGATYVVVGLLFAWPVTHAQMWGRG